MVGGFMQYIKIRNLREDNDMTQKDIATLLKVRRSTYTMWELGDVNFPITQIIKLAEIFETNVEYLLGLSNDKQAVHYKKKINYASVGNALRNERIKRGKTQKEFADCIGIRQSSYSYYEDGKTKIPTEKLVFLAKEYHISLNQVCVEIKEDIFAIQLL